MIAKVPNLKTIVVNSRNCFVELNEFKEILSDFVMILPFARRVTSIGGLVYMYLPRLWVNLRYFGHVF